MNHKPLGYIAITVALLVVSCGPTVPPKPVDDQKAAQQAYAALAALNDIDTKLDADSRNALEVLGIDLSDMKALGLQANAQQLQGQQAQQMAAWMQGLLPQANLGLQTGTYEEDPNGTLVFEQYPNRKFKKTAETPNNGLVFKLNVGGKVYTYETLYLKTVTIGQQVVVHAGSMTVKLGTTELANLTLDSNATACPTEGMTVSSGNFSVKLGNSVNWTGNFNTAGTTYTASTNFSLTAGNDKVTAGFNASAKFSAPLPYVSVCKENLPANTTVNLEEFSFKGNAQVNKTSAKLEASGKNLKLNISNSNAIEGTVAATLKVETPEVTGTLLQLSGELKDGNDADVLPGDQVPVTFYLADATGVVKVNTTLQKLLERLQPK